MKKIRRRILSTDEEDEEENYHLLPKMVPVFPHAGYFLRKCFVCRSGEMC